MRPCPRLLLWFYHESVQCTSEQNGNATPSDSSFATLDAVFALEWPFRTSVSNPPGT